MTDLGTLGGRRSEAVAIKDAGQVTGISTTAPEPARVPLGARTAELRCNVGERRRG
jgi:hypothetical protein